MCVICYKKREQKLPTEDKIRAMWTSNPDGAGIMWKTDKGVNFDKGFMHLSEFLDFVKKHEKKLAGAEVAMHFRIGTHGGNTPGNTHPFIVDSDADPHVLSGRELPFVLMHNGVLPIGPRRKDISDTAELALRAGGYDPPDAFLCSISDMIGQNKIVVFRKDGDALFVGAEWKTGDDGLLYSNLNHEWAAYSDRDWHIGFHNWHGGWSLTKNASAPTAVTAQTDEDGRPLFSAWDVELPDWLNVGLDDADLLARDVITMIANEYGCDPVMTQEEWNQFFTTYQPEIEEQFWAEWDEQTAELALAK